MNDLEHEKMEAELRRLAPAQPPENFMARLVAAEPVAKGDPAAKPVAVSWRETWLHILHRLAPATAVAAVVAVTLWRTGLLPVGSSRPISPGLAVPPVGGDEVKIDRELVSSFDAIGRLPDGEPVRFRCQNWMDQVVLRDPESGLLVQQSTPRMEVVPVRFETY